VISYALRYARIASEEYTVMGRPSRRVPVTASLETGVVRALDDLAKRRGLSSRSRAVEEALSYWLAEQERRRVEQDVEAYYRGLSGPERGEEAEWARFASRSARHLACEQITCLDKALLDPRPLGRHLSLDRMQAIERALLISLGIFDLPAPIAA
jgi:Arc/MetJ-type ribon-helix-helix transcriptional regulator